jgi:OmpA-OmpF porin, OOP family
MLRSSLVATTFAVFAATGGAWAETLSDEEILNRFLIQRDAFLAVKSGKGATRGLKIVTVEELDAPPTAADTAPEAAPDTVSDTAPVVVTETAPVSEPSVDTSPETLPDETDVVVTEPAPTPLVEPDADKPAGVELAAAEVGLLPEELQVNVRITFGYDSATIPADQIPVIEQMCRVIKLSDINLFRIMGHTDSAGSDEYNEKLSLLRAEEVKRRLVTDCGIDPSRLDPMGLGERFLSDPADPKGGENRRVEFQALS